MSTENAPESSSTIPLSFRNVQSDDDVARCFEMEVSSYPPDEAASLASLSYRKNTAGAYFRVATSSGNKIVGFVCATRLEGDFTEESMTSHVETGPILAIHSVVVEEINRRKGWATLLLKDYVNYIENLSKDSGIDKIVLLAKEHLLGFYVKCGFTVVRPSPIVHGSDLWFELERKVAASVNDNKSHPLWVLDAFVSSPTKGGTGNPAGVVLFKQGVVTQELVDGEWVEWLAMVARQVNHAETAFLWKLPGHNEYGIRYYTCNGSEVALCGHATLTSAAVLAGLVPKEKNQKTTITFQARKNALRAIDDTTAQDLEDHPAVRRISMTFPWRSLAKVEEEDNLELIRQQIQAAFPWAASSIKEDDFLFMGVDDVGEDLLVEVTPQAFALWSNPPSDSDSTILYQHLAPSAMNEVFTRGLIICSLAEDPEVDFVSRFFAPLVGIPEDPVTGSAHCTLGPYFGAKCAKNTLVGRQESPRGGVVTCQLLPEENKVELVGMTKVALEGRLRL